MEKILNISKIAIIAISILMVLLFSTGSIQLEGLIVFAEILIGLLVVGTIAVSAFNIIENPKSGIKFIIGLVVIVLCYAIGLSMSSDSIDPATQMVIEGSKETEAGIRALWMMVVLSIGAIIFSSVKKIIG